MTYEVVLPPVFLPFLRDSATTFWDFANAECDITINHWRLVDGLERISVDGDMCDCLTKIGFKRCTDDNLYNLSYGKLLIEKDNVKLELGDIKRGTSFFGINMLKYMKSELNKILYGYGRGFMVLRARSFTSKGKKISLEKGRVYLSIEGWSHGLVIENGAKFGKIPNSMSYLLISDIVLDKGFISDFIKNEYKELKDKVDRVVKVFKGSLKEEPIIQDIMYERVLLEIIGKSLGSSISYALNWPTLRLYVDTSTSLIMVEFPSTVFDTAKAAILESAEELGMSPRELVYNVSRLLDNGINGKALNDLYILASSVLQGRPDVDLLYRIWRDEKVEGRA